MRKETGIADIVVDIKREKWSWAGHVMGRADDRRTIRVKQWVPGKGSAIEGGRN